MYPVTGSNRRPSRCKRVATSSELTGHYFMVPVAVFATATNHLSGDSLAIRPHWRYLYIDNSIFDLIFVIVTEPVLLGKQT